MTQPISCLHYISEVRLELGGVVHAVLDMCQAVASRGHQVTLVTCDATDVPDHWSSNSGNWPKVVEVPRSPFFRKAIRRDGIEQFKRLIENTDVAHLHTPWEISNLQLARQLKRKGVPYVVTVHGMLDDWSMQQKTWKKKLYLALLGRRLFKDATSVHLTAESERDQASHWVPIGEREAIQCYALDLTSYDPLPGPGPAMKAYPFIDSEKKKLLFLSRLHIKKGIELLLKAGSLLKESGLPIQLLIAGPGEDAYVRQLQALATQLKLDEETHFLGMVRGVEKRSLFELADVFVLPTHQENFGLVLAEAMACATPVVTTKGTDIWREVEQGGARIADMTPESIAEKIREVVSDDVQDKIGQQGCEFIHQWLDRNTVVDGYEKIYYRMIGK